MMLTKCFIFIVIKNVPLGNYTGMTFYVKFSNNGSEFSLTWITSAVPDQTQSTRPAKSHWRRVRSWRCIRRCHNSRLRTHQIYHILPRLIHRLPWWYRCWKLLSYHQLQPTSSYKNPHHRHTFSAFHLSDPLVCPLSNHLLSRCIPNTWGHNLRWNILHRELNS